MLKQNLKIFFFLIIFFNIFLFSNFVFADPMEFNPQVTLSPEFQHNNIIQIGSDSIGRYLKSIYDYSLKIVGILSTVVMMWGGVLWISSAGNAERVGEAKAWISAALSGLALALCSYTILFIVNPKLLTFNDLKIEEPNKTPKEYLDSWRNQIKDTCDQAYPDCRAGKCSNGGECKTIMVALQSTCGCSDPLPVITPIETPCGDKAAPDCGGGVCANGGTCYSEDHNTGFYSCECSIP